MATHFREYWLFGLFFAVVTPLQLAWAELVRRRPADLRLLVTGAAGSLAVACTWAISRVVGLPIGPERFQAEAIGLKDVLATLDELSIAALVATLVLRRRAQAAPAFIPACAWILVAASVLAAFLGGH
jgi:hypothetical protein